MMKISLREDAKLNTLGKIAMNTVVSDNLKARLNIIGYRKEHPDVADYEIKNPVFVVGLPRSGTSFLLHVLAHDDLRFRGMRFWELNFPYPPPFPNSTTDSRIMKSDFNLGAYKSLLPNVEALYTLTYYFIH
mmetsp:Transcript_4379/g.5521  ORF Transcript_4379/g.5521 Transcript_4379/m.5521 type:complete len:132 (-) Transcript_4379:3-398(-)